VLVTPQFMNITSQIRCPDDLQSQYGHLTFAARAPSSQHVACQLPSFIHVTPVAEAQLSNASPFQTPLALACMPHIPCMLDWKHSYPYTHYSVQHAQSGGHAAHGPWCTLSGAHSRKTVYHAT
jgi:hypothetical protein